ncbi:unnamed protein product [Effrenium voratum]|nr:unnamed protein product [Effrenium voratum]
MFDVRSWAEQYFIDPERFFPDASEEAMQVAMKEVPSSLLPEALRPLPEGTKVRVTRDDATLERTQRMVWSCLGPDVRWPRKELLGQVGTVMYSEPSETNAIQVQFSPELVTAMRSDLRGGWRAQRLQALEKQGVVFLHRQALEIEVDVAVAATRKKSKWAEVWESLPAGDKERLHDFIVRLDFQLMNAQPAQPRQFLIDALAEGNPLTSSTVYPCFLGDRPQKVVVKAQKPLGKQEANEAWPDLERALFLPDIFGLLGSGGDETRMTLLRQLLIRRSDGPKSFECRLP